jgi:hypothetical protein
MKSQVVTLNASPTRSSYGPWQIITPDSGSGDVIVGVEVDCGSVDMAFGPTGYEQVVCSVAAGDVCAMLVPAHTAVSARAMPDTWYEVSVRFRMLKDLT